MTVNRYVIVKGLHTYNVKDDSLIFAGNICVGVDAPLGNMTCFNVANLQRCKLICIKLLLT